MSQLSARRRAKLLRPARFDELGLRRALSDRMLPFLVAAMTFLGALGLAGAVGASALVRGWALGAGATVTVQVPHPKLPAESKDATRLERVLKLLRNSPEVASARVLSDDELGDLLRPWLGAGVERLAIPLPAVIDVRLAPGTRANPEILARTLDSAAPGTLLESHGVWLRRLSAFARSVQACAALALLVVAAVACAVVAVATRAGLVARRDAIEIVHALGATDGYIAARFARRAARLATLGGIAGALAAMPLLISLANLAAPLGAGTGDAGPANPLAALPPILWLALPGLPATAGLIGFLTAHGTVRRWLRRLP